MEVRRLNLKEWDRHLPSRGFGVFHTAEALRVLDRYADADMRLFGGYKGEELVGLLPVFVRQTAVGRMAFSPPPSLSVPHMGPILMPASPKRGKIERVNRDFARGIIEALDVNSRFTLFRMVGAPEYRDPRPFAWTDQEIETRFTYILDVPDDPEDLLGQLSADLRRDIRKMDGLDPQVSVEGPAAAEQVARDVIARYDEKNTSAPVTVAYVRDLVAAVGERARTYVARTPDGEYLGGIIALYSNDRAYFWQGGVARCHEGVSVNAQLHWRIIEDIASGTPIESVSRYDLVGANMEQLSDYKAKFGAELVPYYVVESSGRGMNVAKTAYQVIMK